MDTSRDAHGENAEGCFIVIASAAKQSTFAYCRAKYCSAYAPKDGRGATALRVCRADQGGRTKNRATLVTPSFRRLSAKLPHDQQRAIGRERCRVQSR